MIIFDTETTGLPQPDRTPLDKHPEIIEFAAVKVNDEWEVVDQIEFFCKPAHCNSLPDKIKKITGIQDEDLVDQKPFKFHYKSLVEFFIGERSMLAHNCAFDAYMLHTELLRLDKVSKFPWPPVHLCTVERSMHIQGKRSSLDYLVKHYLDRDERKGSHRALVDVMDLLEVCRCMNKEGLI